MAGFLHRVVSWTVDGTNLSGVVYVAAVIAAAAVVVVGAAIIGARR